MRVRAYEEDSRVCMNELKKHGLVSSKFVCVRTRWLKNQAK